MQRIFAGLAVGIALLITVLPLTDITSTYPADAIGQNIQWSANDCFNYTATITIVNLSHTVSTARGYFMVLLEKIFPANGTATLRIEQNVAYRGANPSYIINVPIHRISSYLPYLMISNLNNISSIKESLNISYGQGLYLIFIQPMENNIQYQLLRTCEVSFNSQNTSGRIYLDSFNGLIVKGSVNCKFTDLNLQMNVEKKSTFVLEGTNVPMNGSINPGGPEQGGSYPPYVTYFYYFIIGILAFLFGVAVIWLLRSIKN